jgi:hypothetical protein
VIHARLASVVVRYLQIPFRFAVNVLSRIIGIEYLQEPDMLIVAIIPELLYPVHHCRAKRLRTVCLENQNALSNLCFHRVAAFRQHFQITQKPNSCSWI